MILKVCQWPQSLFLPLKKDIEAREQCKMHSFTDFRTIKKKSFCATVLQVVLQIQLYRCSHEMHG